MEWVHGLNPKSFIQEVDSIDQHIEYMLGFCWVLATVVLSISLFQITQHQSPCFVCM
jgi:hypothetical protein